MQPVRAPGAGVLQRPHGPQVDQVAPGIVGDAAQVHVVRRDPAAQQPDHREHARIEAGEDDHPAACRLQLGHGRLELRGECVHVGPAEDVVPARGQADQVRCQFDGPRHLLGHDLAEQLPSDGQVGVPEPGPPRGQGVGHPVGPAQVTAVGTRVVEPLGETVADRHVGADSARQVTFAHPLHDAIPGRGQLVWPGADMKGRAAGNFGLASPGPPPGGDRQPYRQQQNHHAVQGVQSADPLIAVARGGQHRLGDGDEQRQHEGADHRSA